MNDVPLEIERKLLVEVHDLDSLVAASTSVSSITQTYLVNDDGLAERVRRREVRVRLGLRVGVRRRVEVKRSHRAPARRLPSRRFAPNQSIGVPLIPRRVCLRYTCPPFLPAQFLRGLL